MFEILKCPKFGCLVVRILDSFSGPNFPKSGLPSLDRFIYVKFPDKQALSKIFHVFASGVLKSTTYGGYLKSALKIWLKGVFINDASEIFRPRRGPLSPSVTLKCLFLLRLSHIMSQNCEPPPPSCVTSFMNVPIAKNRTEIDFVSF